MYIIIEQALIVNAVAVCGFESSFRNVGALYTSGAESTHFSGYHEVPFRDEAAE